MQKYNIRRVTDKQEEYLEKISIYKDNKMKVPEILGKLDLRKKNKKIENLYFSILKAINESKHLSPEVAGVTEKIFMAHINRLIENDMIIFVEEDFLFFVEAYILTEKAHDSLNKKKYKALKLIQEMIENTASKAIVGYNQSTGNF